MGIGSIDDFQGLRMGKILIGMLTEDIAMHNKCLIYQFALQKQYVLVVINGVETLADNPSR